MTEELTEENNGRMTPATFGEFKKHRDGFLEAFGDYDEGRMNDVLQNLPANIREDKEYRFIWKGCPLYMTACYYARNKTEGLDYPVPGIEELKALLDENTSD